MCFTWFFVACLQQAYKHIIIEITLAFDRIAVVLLLKDFFCQFCVYTHHHKGLDQKAVIAI